MNEHLRSVARIPANWKKCGEVYCDARSVCLFVCSVCLEGVECFEEAYATSDASVFRLHIQENHTAVHRTSYECNNKGLVERTADTSVVESFNKKTKVDEVICINDDDTDTDNRIELCDEENKSALRFLEMDADRTNKSHENSPATYTFEKSVVGIKKPVENKSSTDIRKNERNISETENTQFSTFDTKAAKEKDNGIFCTSKERRVEEYSGCNDFIEISDEDDEDIEDNKDNVSTRPNSPNVTTLRDATESDLSSFSLHNTGIQYGQGPQLNGSDKVQPESPALPYNLIPTPETSPNHISFADAMAQSSLQCRYCSRSFKETWQWDRHQRVHLTNSQAQTKGLRAFQCTVCGRRTSTSSAMVLHQQRYHSADTNLEEEKCNICGSLVLQVNMRSHKRTHKQVRWKCSLCGCSYSTKQSLKKHVEKAHGNILNRELSAYPMARTETAGLLSHAGEGGPASSSSPELTPEEREFLFSLYLRVSGNLSNNEKLPDSWSSRSSYSSHSPNHHKSNTFASDDAGDQSAIVSYGEILPQEAYLRQMTSPNENRPNF